MKVPGAPNVTRLQWKQISLERRHLWVAADQHKNGRAQAVPLNDLAMEVLLRRQGDHVTHVFTYEGSSIVQVNTKAWRKALVRAGIEDFRWHDLRHTFATCPQMKVPAYAGTCMFGGSSTWARTRDLRINSPAKKAFASVDAYSYNPLSFQENQALALIWR